jgi:hypothetical protein
MYLSLALSMLLAAQAASPQPIVGELTPMVTDVDKMLGSGTPLKVDLLPNPPAGVKPLDAPSTYGTFKLDGAKYSLALTVTKDDLWVFYADLNGDGVFQAEERSPTRAVTLSARNTKGEKVQVPAHVTTVELKRTQDGREFGYPVLLAVAEPVKDVSTSDRYVAVVREYARSGTVKLGLREYKVTLDDTAVTGSFEYSGTGSTKLVMYLDMDGDGVVNALYEKVDISKGFQIGEGKYKVTRINRSGTRVELAPSQEAQRVLHDTAKGAKIPPFTAPLLNGDTLRFPDGFQGKTVLIVFWSAGDSNVENLTRISYLSQFYETKGLVVIGISVDPMSNRAEVRDKARSCLPNAQIVFSGMPGGGPLASQFNLLRAPSMFVVDGTTSTMLMDRAETKFKTMDDWMRKLFEGK